MLAQDVRMWGFNVYYLIGLLICGGLGLVVLGAVFVGIRMVIFSARQRASFQEYERRTRRADGKRYPPAAVGTCEECRRICQKVYHLKTGERLCPDSYEPFWRRADNWIEPAQPKPAPRARSAHPAGTSMPSGRKRA